MSREHKPLLSDEDLIATDDRVRRATLSHIEALRMVRDHYESARAKDVELIQKAVDLVREANDAVIEIGWEGTADRLHKFLVAAKEQGFTPTQQR